MSNVKSRPRLNRWGLVFNAARRYINQHLSSILMSLCLFQGVKLVSLPPILCVHLKRFRNRGGYTRKLDCRVTFPENFVFSALVQEGLSPDFDQVDVFTIQFLLSSIQYFFFWHLIVNLRSIQNGCTYTLYAVVVHSGWASCGHYTAYVRDRVNKRWFYTDDSDVEQVCPITLHLTLLHDLQN